MKRGRRNSKSEWEKGLRRQTREQRRAFLRGPDYEDIMIALFDAMKLPVEHWPYVYVVHDFGDGRTVFEATDKEMGQRASELVQAGKMQAFLRKSCEGADAAHCAEVERVITELEGDLSPINWARPPRGIERQ